MNSSVTVKRSYNIGPYEQLELFGSVNEVPDELVLNDRFLNLLRMYLLLGVEKSYRKYLQIKDIMSQLELEEALAKINELNTHTIEELKKILNETTKTTEKVEE